jgi:hypothetical protein
MSGQTSFAPTLFSPFSLDERAPAGHLLRRIAEVVDVSFVRRLTARCA